MAQRTRESAIKKWQNNGKGGSSMRLTFLIVLLLAFFGLSVYLVHDQGFFGFLALARRDPWGLQLLLDLTIALSLFLSWMIPDARRRGLPYLPYVLGTLALGSIGALAYLIHREIAAPRGGPLAAA
jgi:hypothetical protein